jgi:DNA-directed RNA polymerase specialized sigma subunit
LTKAERSVILLRFYYDETMIKTAKILKMSPNTVSLIQHSALAKLKARLNEEDYNDER